MKTKVFLLLAILAVANTTFSQQKKKSGFTPGQKKPALFGVAFTLSDFNAPKNFGSNSNAFSLAIKDMSAGVSLSYWKGITPFIDFSTRLNGVFHDYSSLYQGLPGKTEIGIELEPTINVRPLRDENIWAPFLTAGIGGGIYTGKIGSYIPLGVGIQFNASSFTYLFIQAQYKWSITPNVVPNNMFYSLGFAQNVGSEDAAPAKAQLPTPPPAAKLPPPAPVVADRDGDGVPDEADACPDVKGLAALKGCPDSDGDGIADKDDQCPNEKGLLKYRGCPIPDTDKDGINDEEDRCPKTPGLARYQGCPPPDQDGDGISDEDDKCPTVKGTAANMGCPEIDAATINVINDAAAHILFATGSSKLLPQSTTSLNRLVSVLKEHPDYKLDISGHTDNVGNPDKNRALSQARVQVVSDYLVKKGIDAKRLNAAGYGDQQPIADNKTAAGRAKNRRVEIKARNY